eukprot:TRINITY_DN3875_c0_g1_i11.p1 TRINITY_DN3875_c0_g1~~TRINITY_DN3875_c0_g1_i11.p1  ORF type:complete len:197 (-),score=33.08 TRINITY_DN3875_c0_g1_i11:237-740(-)
MSHIEPALYEALHPRNDKTNNNYSAPVTRYLKDLFPTRSYLQIRSTITEVREAILFQESNSMQVSITQFRRGANLYLVWSKLEALNLIGPLSAAVHRPVTNGDEIIELLLAPGEDVLNWETGIQQDDGTPRKGQHLIEDLKTVIRNFPPESCAQFMLFVTGTLTFTR